MLGDGILSAEDLAGRIEHPVLTQRLELHFNPSVPEFQIVETDDPPELAMGVIASVVDSNNEPLANSRQLAKCQVELSENATVHPLGGAETSGFLARLANGVFARGQFVEPSEPTSTEPDVQIRRSPLLYLAPRTGAFSKAIESALQRIQSESHVLIPRPLAQLVGIDLDEEPISGVEKVLAETAERRPSSNALHARDLLLTRPANPEQEHVIRQLDQNGMVLVQGPPGTGKTHTIANLIGHALAQGKTVLVTSHTSKALRVVREKIVPELQPLCVSLLATDTASRQELKQAVATIGHQLGAKTQEQLDADCERFRKAHADCLAKVKTTEAALRQAVRDEYVDIIVAGQGTAPAKAARIVAQEQGIHSWLPGPISGGVGLPLSPSEIVELYRTTSQLTERDEAELAGTIANAGRLPTPVEFQALAMRIQQLRPLGVDRETSSHAPGREVTVDAYQQAIDWFESTKAAILAEPIWYQECAEAGLVGKAAVGDWNDLISMIGCGPYSARE